MIEYPKVSVVTITYGHEQYITQTLDGVLMQNYPGEIEFIIADDNSADTTEDIITNYFSNKNVPLNFVVKYTKHEVNKGMMHNFIWALQQASGKYIALCEGDDYWTDPTKLQAQVDFLETNKEFAFTFHAVEVKNEIPDLIYAYPKPTKNILTFTDILKKHYIATCSLLFRRNFFAAPYPEFYRKCKMGDIPLELLLASKGKIYFFDEKMAVYRKNEGGITLSLEQKKLGREAYVFIYKNILKYLFPKYFFALSLKLVKTKAGYIKDFIK